MDNNEDLIKARMEAYLDNIDQRDSLTFNGVMGAMPEWVPDKFKDEFRQARNFLLNNYSENTIINWILEYKTMLDAPYGVSTPQISYEIELQPQIARLFKFSHAVELGETEGLRLLAGDLAVMGSSYSKEQSKRAKEPRKLTETHKSNIRKKYIQAQKEGSVYGVVKSLARLYGVEERTIYNVVKDFKK